MDLDCLGHLRNPEILKGFFRSHEKTSTKNKRNDCARMSADGSFHLNRQISINTF